VSLETYWLVVPLAGIALSVPVWAWLLLTHHHDPARPSGGGGRGGLASVSPSHPDDDAMLSSYQLGTYKTMIRMIGIGQVVRAPQEREASGRQEEEQSG
jgi:hypothetical protein